MRAAFFGFDFNDVSARFAGSFQGFAGFNFCNRVAGQRAAVFFAGKFFQLVEDRTKDVGLVIGNFCAGEIGKILRALNDRSYALETHAGINMLGGQRRKRAVGIRVELDEDEIPDFDAARIAFVHKASARVTGGSQINVQFRARAARAGFAHHPEVVFLVAVNDVNFRIESGSAKFFRPETPRFLIEFARIVFRFVGIVNGGIKALRRKFPDADDEFPRPINRFLFEIIAEAPVAEHLKKGVVVGVEADVVEVVVLAAGADALLRVRRAAGRVRTFDLPKKNRDELVHARVREQQVWRVGHQRTRRHDGVLLRLEEVEERLADLGAGHHGKFKIKNVKLPQASATNA